MSSVLRDAISVPLGERIQKLYASSFFFSSLSHAKINGGLFNSCMVLGGLPAGSVPHQFTLCEPCLNLPPLFSRHQGDVLQITGTKKLPGIYYRVYKHSIGCCRLHLGTPSHLNGLILKKVQNGKKVHVGDL